MCVNVYVCVWGGGLDCSRGIFKHIKENTSGFSLSVSVVGFLVGQLVGWLADWLVGWSVGRSVG